MAGCWRNKGWKCLSLHKNISRNAGNTEKIASGYMVRFLVLFWNAAYIEGIEACTTSKPVFGLVVGPMGSRLIRCKKNSSDDVMEVGL